MKQEFVNEYNSDVLMYRHDKTGDDLRSSHEQNCMRMHLSTPLMQQLSVHMLVHLDSKLLWTVQYMPMCKAPRIAVQHARACWFNFSRASHVALLIRMVVVTRAVLLEMHAV